jgi:hypothetical protein
MDAFGAAYGGSPACTMGPRDKPADDDYFFV